eukprot:m.429058 g.429058  ORF g.429058 m.429058 type:complete len:62 (-) comp56714_c0_seq7:55-240(-)
MGVLEPEHVNPAAQHVMRPGKPSPGESLQQLWPESLAEMGADPLKCLIDASQAMAQDLGDR